MTEENSDSESNSTQTTNKRTNLLFFSPSFRLAGEGVPSRGVRAAAALQRRRVAVQAPGSECLRPGDHFFAQALDQAREAGEAGGAVLRGGRRRTGREARVQRQSPQGGRR